MAEEKEIATAIDLLRRWRLHEVADAFEQQAAELSNLRAQVEALIERVSDEQDRCAMEVWYTMQKYLADPDDDGVEHWLREAELAIRSRAATDAARTGGKG